MDKYGQFLQLIGTLSFFFALISMLLVTGAFGVITDIWRRPTAWKTGSMCAIAFVGGAIAMFIAK